MSDELQQHAGRLRSAVEAGDFDSGRVALAAYTAELERAVHSAPDRATLSRLEGHWNHLLVWTRAVVATSLELARSESARLQHVRRYVTPPAEPVPSVLNATG